VRTGPSGGVGTARAPAVSSTVAGDGRKHRPAL